MAGPETTRLDNRRWPHRSSHIVPLLTLRYKSCTHCCLGKLAVCNALGAGGPSAAKDASLFPRERRLSAGSQVYIEGERVDTLMVIAHGGAFRYKMLPDGRRQILDFLISGDVIALPDPQMTAIGYSVEAMTALSLCVFPARQLRRLVEGHRDIGCGLWAVERYNQNRLLEHFASIGRRSALERLAHLLLEIHYRLADRGLASEKAFLFPASQYQIGDAINLTNAHVSRLFRRLKDDGIAEISCGQVVLLDRERLCALCGFDDAYLCLDCLRAAHNVA